MRWGSAPLLLAVAGCAVALQLEAELWPSLACVQFAFSTAQCTCSMALTGTWVHIDEGLVPGDVLVCNECTRLGLRSSYNSTSGELQLTPNGATATLEAFTEALASVVFKFDSSRPLATFPRRITYTLGKEKYFKGNGHMYDFFSTLTTWNTATAECSGKNYFGLTGYLATITSKDERDFIVGQEFMPSWLGGSDRGSESFWHWKTGPEGGCPTKANQVCGSGDGAYIGKGDVPAPGVFVSWDLNEPNNKPDIGSRWTTEDCLIIWDGNRPPERGMWNDAVCEDPKYGYVCEYGGMGDACLPYDILRGVAWPTPTATATATIPEAVTPTPSRTATQHRVSFTSTAVLPLPPPPPTPTRTALAEDTRTLSFLSPSPTGCIIPRSITRGQVVRDGVPIVLAGIPGYLASLFNTDVARHLRVNSTWSFQAVEAYFSAVEKSEEPGNLTVYLHSSSYDAPPEKEIVLLHFTINGRELRCVTEVAALVPEVAPLARKTAVVSLGAAALVNPAAAATAGTMATLEMTLRGCPDDGDRMGLLLHPTQSSIGNNEFVGAVVLNLVGIAVVGLLHRLVVEARRRLFRSKDTAISAAATLRFPGAPLMVLYLLYHGMVLGAARLVYSSHPLEALVGVVGLLLGVGMPVVITLRILTKASRYCRFHALSTPASLPVRVLVGDGEWVAVHSDFLYRYGFLFTRSSPTFPTWLGVLFANSFVVGVISGIPKDSFASCAQGALAFAFLSAFRVVALVYYRPYLLSRDNCAEGVVAVLHTILMLTHSIAFWDGSSPHSGFVGVYLVVAIIVILGVKTILDIAGLVYRLATHRVETCQKDSAASTMGVWDFDDRYGLFDNPLMAPDDESNITATPNIEKATDDPLSRTTTFTMPPSVLLQQSRGPSERSISSPILSLTSPWHNSVLRRTPFSEPLLERHSPSSAHPLQSPSRSCAL